MLSILDKIFSRHHAEILFFLFSPKTEFDKSCKLSLLETICMKCQVLFSRGIRKISLICLSSA